jgi:SAM-dependent methyltransferase
VLRYRRHVPSRRRRRTGPPAASFDAVICVFGVFFLPVIEDGIAELWRLVRPGGRLAVTVWGPRLFEPGAEKPGKPAAKARRVSIVDRASGRSDA